MLKIVESRNLSLKIVFKIQMYRSLYIYHCSTYLFTDLSVCIMLLYPIWSLSPGSGHKLLFKHVIELNWEGNKSSQWQKKEKIRMTNIGFFFLFFFIIVFIIDQNWSKSEKIMVYPLYKPWISYKYCRWILSVPKYVWRDKSFSFAIFLFIILYRRKKIR